MNIESTVNISEAILYGQIYVFTSKRHIRKKLTQRTWRFWEKCIRDGEINVLMPH